MFINDILYGNCTINEPVLLELIESPEIQRLKKICMGGYYPGCPYTAGHKDYNRYTHSIGVMLLLRKFGAPLAEQIAGLIHDVSHSAFSHTIDYIIREQESEKTQNHQDNMHDNFVRQSSLADIIAKYGYDIDYILDDSHFSLKENELPDICADRIDYGLRAGILSGDLSIENKDKILNNLIVYKGSFMMKDADSAYVFSSIFHHLNQEMWAGLPSAILFCISSLMFRRAIKIGIVCIDDFYNGNDEDIIAIIESQGLNDEELGYYYRLLQNPPEYFCGNSDNYLDKVFCKIRTVNPCFINAAGEPERLSAANKKYADLIAEQPKFKEYRIGILNRVKD